jgi:hypothetical protein
LRTRAEEHQKKKKKKKQDNKNYTHFLLLVGRLDQGELDGYNM